MSAYFDRLESELRAAVPLIAEPGADTRAGGRARVADAWPRRWRTGLGRAGLALSVAVVVAVVIVALSLAGRARLGPEAPTGVSSGQRPYDTPTLHQWLSNFAVLRRAHTASDNASSALLAQMATTPGQEDPTVAVLPRGTSGAPWVIRLARTLPDGTRVFLAALPVTGRSHGRNKPFAGGYELWQWMLDRNGGSVGAFFGPRDYQLRGQDDQAPNRPQNAAVVPDGVSSVQWTYCAGSPVACGGNERAIEQRPVVSDNVVAAPLPAACHVTDGCVTGVTWYGADGRVVARFPPLVFQDLPAPPFIVPGNPSGPALAAPLNARAAAALAGSGLVGTRFGTSMFETLQYAQELAGLSAGVIRGGTCGIDHVIEFTPSYLGSLVASTLMLTFRHGRFAGYQYGSEGARPVVLPRQPSRLTTAAGLGIGDTLARGRQLYGRAFKISPAQGGSWSVRTPAGRIDGFATGWKPTSRVTTIDAGNVGCPALSP